MKYTLFYVQRCSPKAKQFNTRKALERFLDRFKTSPDDWLDFYTTGKVVYLDPSWKS